MYAQNSNGFGTTKCVHAEEELWFRRAIGKAVGCVFIIEVKVEAGHLEVLSFRFNLKLIKNLRPHPSRGGGVAALVSEAFDPKQILINDLSTHEHVLLLMKPYKKEIVAGAAYVTSEQNATAFAKIFEYFLEAYKFTIGTPPIFFIDLNMKDLHVEEKTLECKESNKKKTQLHWEIDVNSQQGDGNGANGSNEPIGLEIFRPFICQQRHDFCN